MFEKEAKEYRRIHGITGGCDTVFKDGAEYGYKLAHEEMDYLNKHWKSKEERKANEWHYCKDELPPRKNSTSGDSKDVFVATKGYGNYEGHYVFAEETWFNINGEIIHAVYAWIELPVPPKESE